MEISGGDERKFFRDLLWFILTEVIGGNYIMFTYKVTSNNSGGYNVISLYLLKNINMESEAGFIKFSNAYLGFTGKSVDKSDPESMQLFYQYIQAFIAFVSIKRLTDMGITIARISDLLERK